MTAGTQPSAPRIHILGDEIARKIAAGEVIERPASVVRELLDNAVDSGADNILVEIEGGGIESIRVVDNGCGMTREDLELCAQSHATSKISSEDDLMNLATLGFRGEALSSIAAVARLEITSGGFRMTSYPGGHKAIVPAPPTPGTIVRVAGLFDEFPARRRFLKRAFSEAAQCLSCFREKALPRCDIAFRFVSAGEEKLFFPAGVSLKARFAQLLALENSSRLLYTVPSSGNNAPFSFELVIGEPALSRTSRRDIYVYINGRRVQEYALVQAITCGAQGYFPNGTFPVAALFVKIDPSLVDFNIHPAKREVRFKDVRPVHRAVREAVRNFFQGYALKSVLETALPGADGTADFYVDEPSATGGRGAKESARERFGYRPVAPFNSERFPKEDFEGDLASVAEPDEGADALDAGEGGFRFIGCALGTFLLAEYDSALFVIDQHAAHERVLYDRLRAAGSASQRLLVPYVIQTACDADDGYIRRMQGGLAEAGFSAKELGGGRWEFDAVPERWRGSCADLERDLLDRRIAPGDVINPVLASAACRSAVMDGTKLGEDFATRLARAALALPDPHCPHGRPVYVKITRRELFSLVKRT